jgi:hypothetical protein
MWHFKKKKVYKVETEVLYTDEHMTFVVKAYDKAGAWKQANKLSYVVLGRCFSIEELKEA